MTQIVVGVTNEDVASFGGARRCHVIHVPRRAQFTATSSLVTPRTIWFIGESWFLTDQRFRQFVDHASKEPSSYARRTGLARPVNFVNAPDTVHVLDMSRAVIEAIHIPLQVKVLEHVKRNVNRLDDRTAHVENVRVRGCVHEIDGADPVVADDRCELGSCSRSPRIA